MAAWIFFAGNRVPLEECFSYLTFHFQFFNQLHLNWFEYVSDRVRAHTCTQARLHTKSTTPECAYGQKRKKWHWIKECMHNIATAY